MTPPRVRRLDARAALRELGLPLTYEGPCPGGQVGAAYVRWPDGRRAVLTRGPDVRPLLDLARAAGVPAPHYQAVRPPFTVQERLPGAVPDEPGPAVVRCMLDVNRRLRGLLAGSSLPGVPLHLRADGPGFCLHGPLREHDGRTRRLLAQIEEIGASFPDRLDGDDLVHGDYHPENVLVDGSGAVTGVVDWHGAARGNGDLDLHTLRFHLARRAPHLLFDVHGPAEPVCWAHMSLRQVDWAIRHFSPAEVTAWLDVAERLRPA
ncbi:phosphotransferase [Nonomuraea pusilla]|uniref:phosphotransferase family protein n=1 Tax=Nonomuraea pusilla TaxID=46177 RepID=UPI0033176C25